MDGRWVGSWEVAMKGGWRGPGRGWPSAGSGDRAGASVTVGLVGVLRALLGRGRVSHGALGLGGALDITLVAQARTGVLVL